MLRLLKEWRVSRSLDEPRPLAPPPRFDRLSVIHDALSNRRGQPLVLPPGDLHDRTMEAVRRASRTRPAPPAHRFSALYATMGAILLLCGLAGIYTVVVPTPQAERVVAQDSGRDADTGPAAPQVPGTFRLAGFVQEFAAPSKHVIQSSLQAPVRYEAQQLLADARRAADMVIDRLPFVGGEVR